MSRRRSRHTRRAPLRLSSLLALLAPLALVLVLIGTSEPGPTPSSSPRPSMPAATAPFIPDATVPADCATGERLACLGQAFGNRAYTDGADVALREIAAFVDTDGRIGSDCHIVTHRIGAAIMARSAGSIAQASAEIGASTLLEFCGAGTFHGLLIELTGQNPDSDAGDLLLAACATDPLFAGDPRGLGSCAHGAGHAFVQAYDWELAPAIEACRRFPDTQEEARMARECAIGAYMEALQNGRAIGLPYVRIGEPTYPCTVINDWSADICWRMAGIVMTADGIAVDDQAPLCRTAPDALRRYACLSAITDGIATAYAEDLALIRNFCATAADSEYPLEDCLLYAAAKRGGDRQHPEAGAVLCRDIVDTEARLDCFGAIGAKLSGQVGLERCDEIVDEVERAACNRSILPPTPGEP